MKRIFILITVIAALVFSGCSIMAGSGVTDEYYYPNSNFDSVTVSSACELSIREGAYYSVTIICDDNLEPYLNVIQSGESLSIGLKPFTCYSFITFKAEIVMPAVKSLKALDASSVKITGFNDITDLSIVLQDASRGDISVDSAESVSANVTDASYLVFSSITGADRLTLDCSQASRLDLSGCYASDAVVNVTNASEAWINVTGSVSGRVTNASVLNCYGRPDLNDLDVDFASSLVSR